MKKKAIILLTGALILTGCDSFDEGSFPKDIENTENNTTEAVETEAAEFSLPSLAGTGIDISEFTLSDEKYDEEVEGEWCYDAERPHYRYDMYTSPDGAKIVFDEEGRVVRFRNSPEIVNADFIESDDVPIDKIQKFVDDTLPEGISITLEPCSGYTEYCPTHMKYYNLIEEVGEDGWVNAKINGDGTILEVDYSYQVPIEDVDTKPYDEEAEAIIKECSADGEGEICEKCFIRADGQLYGSYSILTGFKYDNDQPAAYGTYVVIVRPEHETVPFKTE